MDNVQDVHWVMPTGAAGSLAGSPISDFVAAGTISDTVSFAKYQTAYFLIFHGVGTAGTNDLTVIPITEPGGSTTTAIPFQYKRVSSVDTNTAWVWATSNTLLTSVGSHQLYVIKVSADDLPLVSGVKYEYAYLNISDNDGAALLGGVIIMMADPRYAQDTTETVIT